jgi:hypothetical protein
MVHNFMHSTCHVYPSCLPAFLAGGNIFWHTPPFVKNMSQIFALKCCETICWSWQNTESNIAQT